MRRLHSNNTIALSSKLCYCVIKESG